MKRLYFLFATIATIAANALAVILPLNGISTKQLSDNLTTVLTPSGSTFAIWSVIYVGLIIISLAIAFDRYRISDSALKLYIVGSLTNISWLFVWHYKIMFFPGVLLVLLLIINIAIMYKLEGWVKHVYLIYTCWTFIASVINLTIVFQYDLGLNKILNWDPQVVAVLLLPVLTIIYVGLSKRFRSVVPYIVGIWAYYGIYQAQSGDIIRFGAMVHIFILTCILAVDIFTYFKEQKNQ